MVASLEKYDLKVLYHQNYEYIFVQEQLPYVQIQYYTIKFNAIDDRYDKYYTFSAMKWWEQSHSHSWRNHFASAALKILKLIIWT